MAAPRQLVAPPTFVDRNFGLLSVVQPRYTEPDAHWRNGVTWQDICGQALSTLSPYCSGDAEPPQVKSETTDIDTFGALPFTVYAKVDCSPVGYTQEEQRARAVDALTRTEGDQVEAVFSTGTVAGLPNKVYPHLQSETAVVEGSGSMQIQLQCVATPVSGAATFEITEGLGILESLASTCWHGQLTLHVPLVLAHRMISSALVKADGAQMKTINGNLVALGAGYDGHSPAGAATPGAAWIYATGPVFAYRSQPETFNFREQFNRENNTLETIVERTYVLGYTCCCMYAVPILTTGGVPL